MCPLGKSVKALKATKAVSCITTVVYIFLWVTVQNISGTDLVVVLSFVALVSLGLAVHFNLRTIRYEVLF